MPKAKKKIRKVLIQYNSAQKMNYSLKIEILNFKKQIP